MSDPSSDPMDDSSTAPKKRWFHFRWRTLLVLPLALLVVFAVYGPRQIAQHRALAKLKELNAIVRTEPVALIGLRELAGDEYAQQIIEVYLRRASIQDEDLSVLSGLSSLQKLELVDSSVSDNGIGHLADSRNLYTLHLAGTRVSDAGLAHLEHLKSLGILSLDRTPITDAGLVHLAALPQLERLYLDDTRIGQDGLKFIGTLPSLKELSLSRTDVTDAGLSHLRPLTQLEILKLVDTGISDEAIVELQTALPKCHIEGPRGVDGGI